MVMSNTWKELDAAQKREAPPSTCRYCGEPVYWEVLPSGKKQPVNATDFKRHLCYVYKTKKEYLEKEAEMPWCRVCDYGAAPIPPWKNCQPCPLFSDGHCTSKGGKELRQYSSTL